MPLQDGSECTTPLGQVRVGTNSPPYVPSLGQKEADTLAKMARRLRWGPVDLGDPHDQGERSLDPARKHAEVDGEVERGGAPAPLQLHDAVVVIDGSIEREPLLPETPSLESWSQLIGNKLLQRLLRRHLILPFQAPVGS
jgi:hypothetical protein